jgi:hypothetical protein
MFPCKTVQLQKSKHVQPIWTIQDSDLNLEKLYEEAAGQEVFKKKKKKKTHFAQILGVYIPNTEG